MVDEQLRAPSEQVCPGGAPVVGVESVRLVDPDPWLLLPSPRQLVTAPRQVFFRVEQLAPRVQPFLTGSGRVVRHCCSPVERLRWVSVQPTDWKKIDWAQATD